MAILDYEYDPKAISAEIKRGIDFLYEAADRKAACGAWADCFSAKGTLYKGEINPVGVPGKPLTFSTISVVTMLTSWFSPREVHGRQLEQH